MSTKHVHKGECIYFALPDTVRRRKRDTGEPRRLQRLTAIDKILSKPITWDSCASKVQSAMSRDHFSLAVDTRHAPRRYLESCAL